MGGKVLCLANTQRYDEHRTIESNSTAPSDEFPKFAQHKFVRTLDASENLEKDTLRNGVSSSLARKKTETADFFNHAVD